MEAKLTDDGRPVLVVDGREEEVTWRNLEKFMVAVGYSELGRGMTRIAWVHPDAPGWVVKTDRDGYECNVREHHVAQSGRYPSPRTALEQLGCFTLLHMERVTPLVFAGQPRNERQSVRDRAASHWGWAPWDWDEGGQVGMASDGRLVCYDLGYA